MGILSVISLVPSALFSCTASMQSMDGETKIDESTSSLISSEETVTVSDSMKTTDEKKIMITDGKK